MVDLEHITTREEGLATLYETQITLSMCMIEMRNGWRGRSKPLIGGRWGFAGYRIVSIPSTYRGLDCVFYAVTDATCVFALATAHTLSGALALARDMLDHMPQSMLAAAVLEMTIWAHLRHNDGLSKCATRGEPDEVKKPKKAQSLPKRRIQIFEASKGKCHYCGVALELTGKWHIEHKMPKALMGSNEPSNLVASCVPCNMKKRDKTDKEFLAQRA